MTLDADAFSAAWNRYPPPSSDEYSLQDFLQKHALAIADLERAKLLFRFQGPTSEINSYLIAAIGESMLRRGQGMDQFVVLAGREAVLLSTLRNAASDEAS